MVTGSRACKSLKTDFEPLPPKMIILDPARTAECPYLGGGGVPDIFGVIHLDEFTSNTYVSFKYLNPFS